MISVGTYLKVVDNSGAKEVKCLKVLGNCGDYGSVGDVMIVSLTKINPSKKLKKGEIHKAVIVFTKKTKEREDGVSVSFEENGAVLVNSKHLPIATRILDPVMLDLRKKKLLKILSLAVVAI